MIKFSIWPRNWWVLQFPRFMKLGAGFMIYLPFGSIQIGYANPPCRVCGSRNNIFSWPEDNPGATICPDCCDHPDYDYDRWDRRYYCTECGNDAPLDHGVYDYDEG